MKAELLVSLEEEEEEEEEEESVGVEAVVPRRREAAVRSCIGARRVEQREWEGGGAVGENRKVAFAEEWFRGDDERKYLWSGGEDVKLVEREWVTRNSESRGVTGRTAPCLKMWIRWS